MLEAVIGLGPNIFYGTQLAACVMVFKRVKPAERRGKVLFVDGADEVRVGRAQNFLEEEHVSQLFQRFEQFEDVENHVKVATVDDLEENEFNLNIPLYVEKVIEDDLPTVEEAMADLKEAWTRPKPPKPASSNSSKIHRMNQQALEKYPLGAATLLRGTIDAGDYKQYIFPLLFYKRICDVYDEEFETALAESDGDLEYAGFGRAPPISTPQGRPLE